VVDDDGGDHDDADAHEGGDDADLEPIL
jgi:hypothetical protein